MRGCGWLRASVCLPLRLGSRMVCGRRAEGLPPAGAQDSGFAGIVQALSRCAVRFSCALLGCALPTGGLAARHARRPLGCPGLLVSMGCVLRVALHVVGWSALWLFCFGFFAVRFLLFCSVFSGILSCICYVFYMFSMPPSSISLPVSSPVSLATLERYRGGPVPAWGVGSVRRLS